MYFCEAMLKNLGVDLVYLGPSPLKHPRCGRMGKPAVGHGRALEPRGSPLTQYDVPSQFCHQVQPDDANDVDMLMLIIVSEM